MQYSLETSQEASRLESQVFQINYRLSDEIQRFSFSQEEKILDAGCGTGVLARYLFHKFNVKQIDGIDSSPIRLEQAQNILTPKEKDHITFYQQNLSQIAPEFHNQYDVVIARYVLEHLENPQSAINELKKCLKPNGRLIIIELDGVFFNLFSYNTQLNQYLEEIKQKVKFDLFIGRKLPNLLKQLNFNQIKWTSELLECQGDRLDQEYQNSKSRFDSLQSFFTNLLGSKNRYEEFKSLYLSEMMKPENTMVFIKYFCSATTSP